MSSVVVDKNGEEIQEVMIGSITTEEEGLVKLLSGHSQKYEDGDIVTINGVDGIELGEKGTDRYYQVRDRIHQQHTAQGPSHQRFKLQNW